MTYEEADKLSTEFARSVVNQLTEFSKNIKQDADGKIVPPVFSENSIEGLYRASMMKSLLLLVPIKASSENSFEMSVGA